MFVKLTYQYVAVLLLCIGIATGTGCATSTPETGTRNGNLAPEIRLTDATGNVRALSDLRGKLVLIEFWDAPNAASRRNHFELQRLYQKYQQSTFSSGTGFTVYSVNLDTDRETWKKAIQEDALTFSAIVNDTAGWNSSAVEQYNIASLPKYFLINENGIIINHNILIPDLERILNDQM